MAVRQQLLEMLLGQQCGCTIVVERPSAPAAALQISPPSSPSSSPSSSPLPSSPPPSSPPPCSPSLPRSRGPLPAECALFHCRGCWAVLGDSLHLCAQEEPCLGLLACLKATKDVTWEDSLMVGLEGALLGCAYYALTCQSCGLAVGFILYSAPSNLAYLRGLFCFFKDSILCYLLKKQMVIEASEVKFPAVTLKEQVQKLKERLVKTHIRIELLMKKLGELQQNNNVAERQSSALDAGGLLPGHGIVRVS